MNIGQAPLSKRFKQMVDQILAKADLFRKEKQELFKQKKSLGQFNIMLGKEKFLRRSVKQMFEAGSVGRRSKRLTFDQNFVSQKHLKIF